MAGSKWLEIKRRHWLRRDPDTGVVAAAGEYPEWYGRLKIDGRWKWFKLFTDKRASQKRWEQIIAQREQRAAGVITPAMQYANTPISPHARAYLDALKLTVDPAHHRIATFMLDRLIELAGWKVLKDMTADSLRAVVEQLQADGKTVSYANKFISRGKAFVHWLMLEPPKLAANPFTSVKRGNVRRAKKNRARRALEDHDAEAFIAAAPDHRQRKYLFAMLAGLRRKELRLLTHGDLRLNAPIPFIQLREEMTKNGHADALPLHPRLVTILNAMPGAMPGTSLFDSVPDVKTLVKDLTAGGVAQLDDRRRRIDFHALRHTFSTNLDRTGCSRATKKALMRHGDEDVTDGYSHAHLAELYEAICRLPDPLEPQQRQAGQEVKTGTASDVSTHLQRRSRAGHSSVMDWHAVAHQPLEIRDTFARVSRRQDAGDVAVCHGLAQATLSDPSNTAILQKTGPGTQAGYTESRNPIDKSSVSDSAGHAQVTGGAAGSLWTRYVIARGRVAMRIPRPITTATADATRADVLAMLGMAA